MQTRGTLSGLYRVSIFLALMGDAHARRAEERGGVYPGDQDLGRLRMPNGFLKSAVDMS